MTCSVVFEMILMRILFTSYGMLTVVYKIVYKLYTARIFHSRFKEAPYSLQYISVF